MTFKTLAKLVLSKTVEVAGKKPKRVEVATVQIPMPILADFGISGTQAIAAEDDKDMGYIKGQPMFDDGVPVYGDPKADFLQTAITARVFSMVRNRFVDGKIKPGAVIPEDFEQLLAETTRSGDALAMRREAKDSFAAYLQSKEKPAVVVELLSNLFYNSAKVLPSAAPKYVTALQTHAGDWIGTLKPEQATRFTPKIQELNESIKSATVSDDIDVS